MSIQQLSMLYEELVESIGEFLKKGDHDAIRHELEQHHPSEIALVIESLPPGDREVLWPLLSPELQGQVLPHLHDIARISIIEDLAPESLVMAGERMDVDQLVEIVEDLPEPVAEAVVDNLDEEERRRFETQLAYPEGTAGRLMHTDLRTVRPELTVDAVLRFLRRYGLTTQTDSVMVVDRENTYLGKLYFKQLVTGDADQTVGDLMDTQAEAIPADTLEKDIALLFEQRELVSVAVVDENNKLLGRISVPDVVDLIRAQADHSLMNMAGLDEDEDLFAPILPSTRRRAVWLGINLVTAFLAAWVIGLFEETLEKIVALAVLMPIVASMGGIGGSQTLTLVIRGLALGQIASSNTRWLLIKEVAIGAINGLIWAAVVAIIAVIWFGSYGIGAIIGVAIIINLIAAALAGIIVPLILHRLGIDPALSGAVVLTTVTDVVGFMTFLGLGTMFLL